MAEALEGADAFFGLSVKGAVTQDMVEKMAGKPIIFAMANPDPEITPEDVKAVRPDAITATGRSDYPNQINNVLGFPYIFRGALDVRASTINEDMKVACAMALAELAREDVPDEVAAAYSGRRLRYGPDYIIPAPFDPRLIFSIPPAVAEAAMASGVARRPIIDMEDYRNELASRLDPTASSLQVICDKVRGNPRRIVFAEGEEEKTIPCGLCLLECGLRHTNSGRSGRKNPADHEESRPAKRTRYRDQQLFDRSTHQRICRIPLSSPTAQRRVNARLSALGEPKPQYLCSSDGGLWRCGRHGVWPDTQLLFHL